MRIWVDAWQFECCGDDFAVGSQVRWRFVPTSGNTLVDVLGAELAGTVDGREEHHDDREATREVSGTVRSVRAVCHDLAPRAGENPRIHYPVPGSAVLTEVRVADGRVDRGGKSTFAGYLVELD